MTILVPFKLALSYLGIRRGKSVSHARKSLYGAVLGIAVSLVPLVVILVVADGMIAGISTRLIELSGSHISAYDISAQRFGKGGLVEFAEEIPRLDTTGNILRAWPERAGIGLVVGPNGRAGGQIRAVAEDFFNAVSLDSGVLRFSSGDGRGVGEEGGESVSGAAGRRRSPDFPRDSVYAGFSGNDAFMGEKLASDLGLKPGDVFRILTMNVSSSGRALPKFSVFKLKDTVSSGYQELDALWVFVPFETGFDLLDENASSTFISVKTTDPFSGLRGELDFLKSLLPRGFLLRTWEDINRSQFHSFNTTRILLLFIGFLILLVAAVNISSAVVMLVLERRRETAILKSAGASPQCIRFSFLLVGFFTGLCGLLIGLPTGVACSLHINGLFRFMERCINIAAGFFRGFENPDAAALSSSEIHLLDPVYYLETIPVVLNGGALFLISAGTLLLSVLVSLVPAWKAGREKPVEILRKM